MGERLRIFYSLAVFWLGFMIIARVVFLLYNADLTAALTGKEIALSMLHGLRMDGSIAGYFLAASGLILSISSFTNSLIITRTLTYLTVILVVLCSILVAVDSELYRHWGFRMNTTPLMYVGSEAMASVPSSVYAKVSFALIILLISFLYLFRAKIYPRIEYLGNPSNRSRSFIILLLISALMVLPIRGSFTVAPMNTGFVYFHNSKAYANHSAVNVVWNFLYNVKKGSSTDYPKDFLDSELTEKLFADMYRPGGPTVPLFRTKTPNIVLIILESFTADVIEPLGGLPGVTPNLNALCDSSVVFTEFYSSGDRTDKGLIAILSGYPAQPNGSVIKLPAKTEKLPQLNRHMKRLGYKTSFVYGGDIDFANFRSYLNASGFDHITTLDDFDEDLYTSKWGVHDHYMFDQVMHELDTTHEKFFKVVLTLSSHEPFDVPLDPPFRSGKDEESQFVNSCHYTDAALGKFLAYCRKKPWWDNTVFVITADHGHRYPRNKQLIQKERFHIPLIIAGGAVAKDTAVHTIGGQTDIANTLLAQVDQPSPAFIFSKNLLSRGISPFAAYYFTDGYGFVLPGTLLVYDNAGKRFLREENATPEQIQQSKAHQQKLYTNYNQLDK